MQWTHWPTGSHRCPPKAGGGGFPEVLAGPSSLRVPARVATFREAAPSPAAPVPVGFPVPQGPARAEDAEELTGDHRACWAPPRPRVTPGRSYRERAPAQPAAASVLQ